jgi:anti-sigma regulatory factor (Ser/Thr protein kinase)
VVEPAAHRDGYLHETFFYGSDAEYLSVVIPFIEGGRAAGEPTVLNLSDRNTALVRGAIGSLDDVIVLPDGDRYRRPAAMLASYRRLFAEKLTEGASQLRVVGEVPHPGTGATWERWARYEAVVNHAFAEVPLWGLCPYDTRTTPVEVLDDVQRTHTHTTSADGGHRPNGAFVEPRAFLAERPPAPSDPLERSTPLVDLLDPSLASARGAVGAVAGSIGLGGLEIEGLLTSTSEVVTNAYLYGQPPVRLRAWHADDRMIVTVTDGGTGPADPFSGLVPPPPGQLGGLGLWVAHHLCAEVALRRHDDGFTVALTATSGV